MLAVRLWASPAEVAQVARHHGQAIFQCDRRDAKVHGSKIQTQQPQLFKAMNGWFRKWYDRKPTPNR